MLAVAQIAGLKGSLLLAAIENSNKTDVIMKIDISSKKIKIKRTPKNLIVDFFFFFFEVFI